MHYKPFIITSTNSETNIIDLIKKQFRHGALLETPSARRTLNIIGSSLFFIAGGYCVGEGLNVLVLFRSDMV